MSKVSLLMAIAIATASVLAMILAPIATTPNVAKAYSCSSSSSAAKTPSSSSSVSGTKGFVPSKTGSCSTSSSSSSKATGFLADSHAPPSSNFDVQANIGFPSGATTSSSSGGSQSSCSSSSADHQSSSSQSISQPGRCQ